MSDTLRLRQSGRRARRGLLLLFLLGAALYASATGTAETDAGQLKPLTIGIMPAVDSIPIIVAQSAGFFEEEGLSVEIELFRDQLYREASLQSGRIDASISDLVNAIRSRANGTDYKVLSLTQGRFSLLTAPNSPIETIEQWPDAPQAVQTGAIEDSVIFYTAVRMLEAAGKDPERMSIVPTLQIPVRLELLSKNELPAAILPEPVARLAVGAGAYEIVDSSVLDWTAGIVVTTERALEDKRPELEAFIRAYNRAVDAFNTDRARFMDDVIAGAGFPPPTAGTIQIPRFQPAAVPTRDQVADVTEWMTSRGLVTNPPAYDELVEQL